MGFQSAKAQITLHPMIGGSLNTAITDDFGSSENYYSHIAGFQAGAGLDITLGDLVSIEPILRYNQKGFGIEMSNFFSLASQKYSLRLHYLDLPVMVNFNTEVGDIKLVYSVGPHVGYCMDAREIITISDGKNTQTIDSKNNSEFMNELVNERDFNRLDFGLAIGCRAEINNFTIGLMTAASIQPIAKNSGAFNSLNYQLNIGYKIEL